jgi:hypothetical protein
MLRDEGAPRTPRPPSTATPRKHLGVDTPVTAFMAKNVGCADDPVSGDALFRRPPIRYCMSANDAGAAG